MSSEQEIRDMAKLSILENKLNDVQLKNLKMFPLIFFNGVSEAILNYDLSIQKPSVDFEIENENDSDKLGIKYNFDRPKASGVIEYKLTMDDSKDNNFLENRFLALENAVHNLFWKEVKIIVLFNNKKVYESGLNYTNESKE